MKVDRVDPYGNPVSEDELAVPATEHEVAVTLTYSDGGILAEHYRQAAEELRLASEKATRRRRGDVRANWRDAHALEMASRGLIALADATGQERADTNEPK